MANITFHGTRTRTVGDLPKLGSKAPELRLTDRNLNDVTLAHWAGKKKLLSIFPSIDTPVCALSTKRFNDYAREHDDTVMLMISADLPFAQARFCGDEELANVLTLSTMRAEEFKRAWGIAIEDGPLAGLTARAVVVLDENDTVVYSELVPEIGEEPNYESALRSLG